MCVRDHDLSDDSQAGILTSAKAFGTAGMEKTSIPQASSALAHIATDEKWYVISSDCIQLAAAWIRHAALTQVLFFLSAKIKGTDRKRGDLHQTDGEDDRKTNPSPVRHLQAPYNLLWESEDRQIDDKVNCGSGKVDDFDVQALSRNGLIPISLEWRACNIGEDNGCDVENCVDQNHGLTRPVKSVAIR